METKKSPKNTPENQTIEQLAIERKTEMLGDLLTGFYTENQGKVVVLKQTVEYMFDTYVADNEDEDERTDAVWFTQNFVNLLRHFSGKLSKQKRGELFKQYILDVINDGNPNIVEEMFYRSVAKAEETITVGVILHFYRSFQRMMEGARVLNGKSVL